LQRKPHGEDCGPDNGDERSGLVGSMDFESTRLREMAGRRFGEFSNISRDAVEEAATILNVSGDVLDHGNWRYIVDIPTRGKEIRHGTG